MITKDEFDNTLEVLVPLGDWAICRWTDTLGPIIYGEHIEGCHPSIKESGKLCHYSWEYTDVNSKGDTLPCWKCDCKVPDEVIGLVLMYNWEKIR